MDRYDYLKASEIRRQLKSNGWHDYQIDVFLGNLESIKNEPNLPKLVMEYLK